VRRPATSGVGERSLLRRIDWRRTRYSVIIAGIILVAFVVVGIFAPWVAPHEPNEQDLYNTKAPPAFMDGGTSDHLLGTDQLGRDILSRIIHGARVSLLVAFFGILGSGLLGITLGVISGYMGGFVDSAIQRIVDVTLGFPIIILAMVVAIAWGAAFDHLILILIVTFWAGYARQSRAETLKLRGMDFVTLAKTSGTSRFVIMARHVLPNIAGSMLVLATLQVGTLIMMEATLSFLGAGVPPPTASWGSMTADGRNYLATEWWIAIMPALAICLVVLASNIFGDWVRDRLDPKLRTL